MSRSRRAVRERDPKVIKLAMSLVGPIWGVALLSFAGNGSVNLLRMQLTDQVDPTPFFVALLLTLLLVAFALVALKIQNAAGRSLAELQAMAPDVFEDWVAARFREFGYAVEVAGAQGDHGVDLVAKKPTELAIIQCKNYRAWSVGEPVLRDLFGAMHDFGADRAYLVTTGRVTQAAARWVEGKPIEIWDGERVAHLSKKAAVAKDPKPKVAPMLGRQQIEQAAGDVPPAGEPAMGAPEKAVPTCPKCGSTLVKRRNRSTGESFLACPGYPACRYTQQIPAVV